MRDVMAHRGPDGAGLWSGDGVVLAHRRLAVVDPSPEAAQPMVSADGRFVLTYNGELYNDAELRAELVGYRFRTRSDTETVLAALSVWGPGGLARLRGMYALGFYDTLERRLLLARDPLGIKPLYWCQLGGELVFASEPRAILAHPRASVRPDMGVVSAYLTTIRTVMGARTLFEGVRTMRPGQAMVFEIGDEIAVRPLPEMLASAPDTGDPTEIVRRQIEDSVRRHLRSDAPICCLLSGGLDSSIVASIAMRELGSLHTYCSGAPETGSADFQMARLVAGQLGSTHTEAPVTEDLFARRWPEMVTALGLPLSTPNEVAINEVSRRLRADGKVVTLSGEGADELFAGYEGPMKEAAGFEGLAAPSRPEWTRAAGLHPGHFQLDSSSWLPLEIKGAVLHEELWRRLEADAALLEFYRSEFETVRAGIEPLQDHLRFQRRINLAGLLQRLDTATMLEGVEGRTPLADARICALAESLPIAEKHHEGLTKRVLRRAFADVLPEAVIARPKASFPLLFERWVGRQAQTLRTSGLAREIFTPAAIETVAREPERLWRLAWPMINIALWGKVWWG